MKFSKQLIKILEKKLGTEAIFDYYDDLTDEWHTSTKDIGGLREYLGLDEEMYSLFLLDTSGFIRALEDKYLEFKINEHISNIEAIDIKSTFSISHEHVLELKHSKAIPIYGRFIGSSNNKNE